RSLIVAVRGKLQSVESGISTFEQEFDRFLVPQFAAEKKQRNRRTPKAVNWLLGGSHTLAIALVAAFLVPASAVGAFALPTNVVGQLAGPFRSAVVDESAAGRSANGIALARGGWSPSSGDVGAAPSPDGARLLALRSKLLGSGDGQQSRQETALPSPPSEPADGPPAEVVPTAPNTSAPPNPDPPNPPKPPADGGSPPVSAGGWISTPPPPVSPTLPPGAPQP